MTLRFKWEWESAPGVRLPELAATWCRLSVDLDDMPATLVERRDGSGGPRHGVDVAAYPLAEHLAVNWWRLSAPSHLSSDRGIRFVDAGSGFAWPDLTLRNDHGLMWVTLRRRDKDPEHIRFLTQGEAVMDAGCALTAMSEFIDNTVRRLEDQGVQGTLLQEEWAAIAQADSAERDYCLVAAAWGHDPYDTHPEASKLLIDAESKIGSPELLIDLARAVPFGELAGSVGWLKEAANAVGSKLLDLPPLGPLDWSSAAGVAPWRVGYARARRLRLLLGWDASAPAPVEEFLEVSQTASDAPMNIDALVKADGESILSVVVGAGASPTTKRFASARAIGRHGLAPIRGLSLLSRATPFTERAERAFAAELLAPADGITTLLAGDYSEASVQRAAKHFKVSQTLIQHQVENQVAA